MTRKIQTDDFLTCRICKQTKESLFFPYQNKADNKRHTICKRCRQYHRAIINLSNDEYQELLERQNYSCAICGIHKDELKIKLYVDHSYATHQVRGLLCHKCNSGLAFFSDSPTTLAMAIEYLIKNDGVTS
jgi:protein-arginine kinase activator protein McsA